MSPLMNVWKFFGKLRKKHQRVQKQTFQQVSKIFISFQKSLEVFGCRFNFFMKSLEIIGSLQMSSKIFGKFRKFVAKYLR